MRSNRELIQGLLKDRIGFEGFVISDYEAIHQIPGDWATQVRTAVNAGIDMAMEPNIYQQIIETLLDEVRAGRVSQARIDDAVRRILTKKFELGLFERPFVDRGKLAQVGSAAHHALARRAAAESQVLLKNRRHTLPLRGRKDVYVAGSNADNIGNQAGGWTLTWQGGPTNVIPGTTILDGIRELARSDVTYSEDASAPIPRRATGIVVVGETPYAEGYGDVFGPRWSGDPGDHGVGRPVKDMQFSAADKAAIDKVCAAAARCVVVVVSGRPLIIDPAQLRRIDGLVAAWLPGSEGAGVADTLFGVRPFTGRLPMTWPRSLEQEPINIGTRSTTRCSRTATGFARAEAGALAAARWRPGNSSPSRRRRREICFCSACTAPAGARRPTGPPPARLSRPPPARAAPAPRTACVASTPRTAAARPKPRARGPSSLTSICESTGLRPPPTLAAGARVVEALHHPSGPLRLFYNFGCAQQEPSRRLGCPARLLRRLGRRARPGGGQSVGGPPRKRETGRARGSRAGPAGRVRDSGRGRDRSALPCSWGTRGKRSGPRPPPDRLRARLRRARDGARHRRAPGRARVGRVRPDRRLRDRPLAAQRRAAGGTGCRARRPVGPSTSRFAVGCSSGRRGLPRRSRDARPARATRPDAFDLSSE
jgi:Glycosyl hydrolase family 3 C-terminal domain/Glycosyl hydrolase family 3 N terminal domain